MYVFFVCKCPRRVSYVSSSCFLQVAYKSHVGVTMTLWVRSSVWLTPRLESIVVTVSDVLYRQLASRRPGGVDRDVPLAGRNSTMIDRLEG